MATIYWITILFAVFRGLLVFEACKRRSLNGSDYDIRCYAFRALDWIDSAFILLAIQATRLFSLQIKFMNQHSFNNMHLHSPSL